MVQEQPRVFRETGLQQAFDILAAGAELFQGQFGLNGLESISTEAGRGLRDAGVVTTVDEGIVLFHEHIGRNKPSLRRVLFRLDRRAGRLPKAKRSPTQKAMAQAVKAGLVVRDKKTGKILRLSPRGRREVDRVKRKEDRKRRDRVIRQQATALKKLKGIGG